MGRLPFPPDAELTGADRTVLSILQKDYELCKPALDRLSSETVEDSDDSATKHSEFVSPSPEGTTSLMLCISRAYVISLRRPTLIMSRCP